jgi:ribosomal-protein-alanine N-acetyltransferase
MTVADLALVEAIEREGQDAPWSRRIFEDCMNVGYDCRIILCERERVGFVIVSRVLDEAHLLNIVLDASWRARGIAREVLTMLQEELIQQGLSLLYLEVRESNTAARRLYEKLGFRISGFRERYYRTRDGGREDAVLMSKQLVADHR